MPEPEHGAVRNQRTVVMARTFGEDWRNATTNEKIEPFTVPANGWAEERYCQYCHEWVPCGHHDGEPAMKLLDRMLCPKCGNEWATPPTSPGA